MKYNVFPLQQGALDWLCSIYAAINAMYVQGKIATLDDASDPFRRAIKFMQNERDWNLSKAICCGIDEVDLGELFKELSGTNWDVDSDEDYPDRLERLEDLLNNGAEAVVVSLVHVESEPREVMHYTVVTGVSDSRFTICDSQGKEVIERKGDSFQYDGADVRLGYLYVMKAK